MQLTIALETTATLRGGADRGIGRYVTRLLEANRALGNNVKKVEIPFGSGRLSELAPLVVRSSRRLRGSDLFHAPTPLYLRLPISAPPMVVSILDVIPLDVRSHRQTGLKNQLFYRLAARASCVLTLSEHAAGRIADVLRVDQDRVIVAPLPPEPVFKPDGPVLESLPHPYVASLVDLRSPDPRKRAPWLTAVASELARNGGHLVLAGGGTEEWLQDSPAVIGLGRIDDEMWAAVLRGADAFVYASAYEGQGLPPLEAMACGTPVVAMDNTAIRELVADAGVLVHEDHGPLVAAAGPHSPRDAGARRLAAATVAVLRDDRTRLDLSGRSLHRAATFSTTRFEAGLARAYELAIREK